LIHQCRKPSGIPGRLILALMNSRHGRVTDWGLAHIAVGVEDTILDVGCGGGRTLNKLAAMAPAGKLYGIDHSRASVLAARKANAKLMQEGRVEIEQASVSELPFPDGFFDLVSAVETHFWWPDLQNDMREVQRVVRPGGTLIVIAEIYKQSKVASGKLADEALTKAGMKLLTVEQHRELLAEAGFGEIQVMTEARKNWICVVGKKLAQA
jgi:ubiquinone/menaquinone biosynthesis C-methylase UbiE